MSAFLAPVAQSPRSPTSSTSGNGNVPAISSSSSVSQKARRSVRLVSQLPDDDSSSEDERTTESATDPLPPHVRHASFPSITSSPSTRRIPTRIPRTTPSSSSMPSRPNTLLPSSSIAPPPSIEPGVGAFKIGRRREELEGAFRPDTDPHMSEVDSSSEDEGMLPVPPTQPAAEPKDAKERYEWRSMLQSVLSGDVLRGESSRIGADKPGDVVFRKRLGDNLWWQIRAKVRARTTEDEKRKCEDRRSRIVDSVLEEVESFHVMGDDALEQVGAILQRLSLVEALYPHQAAIRSDKPLYDTIQTKIDALCAWSTIFTSLRAQMAVLQKWTGTDDLDVTRRNTTKEKALVAYHPLDNKGKEPFNDAADDSTFLERVLKEADIQHVFEKRVFLDLLALLHNAKDTVITYQPTFEELGLPDFRHETVSIIGFPGRLIVEILKQLLDTISKSKELDARDMAGMVDNLRMAISLAVIIKRQHEDIVAPDADKRWNAPNCLPPEYDATLVNGIRAAFKLLHHRLKDSDRALYFRETDVLEEEWEFMGDAAEAVAGADIVVAEQFCALTNKLLIRITKSFHQQLQATPKTHEDQTAHYVKMLDIARMRYRKLQRFARRLAQKFENSAEYSFDDQDLDTLIERLQLSGHFLIYTSLFEDTGTYILASSALWNDAAAIRRLLFRSFLPRSSTHVATSEGSLDGGEDDDGLPYLILISPRSSFAWTGGVMTMDLGYIDFALADNRVRLIAEGPGTALLLARQEFSAQLDEEDADAEPLHLDSVSQGAHLPRIQRELLRISRSVYRLSESFIQSATFVAGSLQRRPGTQDLVENWYLFASDHGRRVASQIDPSLLERFSRLLIRLAIGWVKFISDSCEPSDRRTFRWTIQALDYAHKVTGESSILYLDTNEFDMLKRNVASLISLLISHFDILGARGLMEAKRKADKEATERRYQKLQENVEDITTDSHVDRSIRLVREERLKLIAELESYRAGIIRDQAIVGEVLHEDVAEDRSLVFLAASASNIALRWQQGAFIGGGANGNVFKGTNLDSGGIMAVKEIRVQDLNNSPALYKQIKDESDVMAMLSHPNIVEYYGIEVHRDRVYIFEEFCSGGSLAEIIACGATKEDDIVGLFISQILSGLEYLHSKGIEHRDIKPDNILLLDESHIKLVDFGAAKVIAKNKTVARTRRNRASAAEPQDVVNSLAGTPMYMAPEVIKNDRKSRLGASDIWSMGCVMLELVTGRKPWSQLDNEWAIMFHIGIATQHPPLPEPGQFSESGIAFIERCLTIDAVERPTAAELMSDGWMEFVMELMVAQPEAEELEELREGPD